MSGIESEYRVWFSGVPGGTEPVETIQHDPTTAKFKQFFKKVVNPIDQRRGKIDLDSCIVKGSVKNDGGPVHIDSSIIEGFVQSNKDCCMTGTFVSGSITSLDGSVYLQHMQVGNVEAKKKLTLINSVALGTLKMSQLALFNNSKAKEVVISANSLGCPPCVRLSFGSHVDKVVFRQPGTLLLLHNSHVDEVVGQLAVIKRCTDGEVYAIEFNKGLDLGPIGEVR